MMLPDKMNRSRRGTGGQKGFTLTELMIALVIMGLIMSVVYKVFSSQDRFFRNQEQIASMQENLRATVEYINQELSWLGYRVPGIAVIKASPSDIIFKANIPNTGTTIQYVRYQFDPSTNTIRRAAGANQTFVENADLTVMASDIEAMAISYYNILNGVVATSAGDPLCADELSSAVCAPGDPDDDSSLLMVQRVKARVTARTSKPDWMYTDPDGGSNPNYRKRRAVLDLRARNIEDVTLQGGQIVVGSCGSMTHTISDYSSYAACGDKTYYQTFYQAEAGAFGDNPSITIQAYDMDGNLNTNPNQVTYVYAVADDGTPYNIYDSADPTSVDNTIANGQTRYVVANDLSTVDAGTQVELRFAYSDGVCTQVSYDGDHDIIIAAGNPSHLYTGGSYTLGGLSLDYVNNSGAALSALGSPPDVAMCSTVGNERVLLGVRIDDDCGNPITGETITWTDGGFGGTFVNEADNGDGTYNATYVPPDTLGSVAPVYTATLGAQWGTMGASTSQGFIAAAAHDIVIDSITDVTAAGIFQFGANVLSRASQLGGNSGNDFTIERIDGQEVGIRFHIEDSCGNRVFDSIPINNNTTKGMVTAPVVNGDGSYSFVWESDIGCGLEQLGETITISTSAIANPTTQSETVSFDLLTTRSSDPLSGPFVRMDKVPIDGTLTAGNTGDYVTVQATLEQYDPAQQYCMNLLAGSMAPFTMNFTVTGDIGGNGSFSAVSPFSDDTEAVSTDALGIAQVDLFSGTADWDDTLTVTADVDVEGANYSGSMGMGLVETIHPQDDSGFYEDSLYTTEIGVGQPDNIIDPGDTLYLQIFDYDENEDPNSQDSFSAPYDVEVTLVSALTGDEEVLGLTEELSGNSPKFRKTLSTVFFPAVATTIEKGDGMLQVRRGDTLTMTYVDKDTPGDTDTWTIYTTGADTFRIYRLGAPDEEIVPPAGPSQVEVTYGDQVRPELSFPYKSGDGSIDTDTLTITADSFAETDTIVMREQGDSGVFVPDWTLYTGSYITLLQTDPTDFPDILQTPSTPRYVNLTYNAGAFTQDRTFFMRDYDAPQVTITAPADGSTVSSEVTVLVDVSDVANATTWGGISRIELYVNGRMIDSVISADLTGSNAFTWTTAVSGIAWWLDGNHTITASAWDISNNQADSAPVSVFVANGLHPVWFNEPGFNSVWSQDMNVQLEVGSLAAESGTHQLTLYVDGSPAMVWSVIPPGGIFNYVVDTANTTTFPSEGLHNLIAVIQDTGGGYQTTALDFIVDRSPPVINVPPPPMPWLTAYDLPLVVDANISDFYSSVDSASVTGVFSGPCASPVISMTEFPPGSGTYRAAWPASSTACADVEGLLRFTVSARDVATPANVASRAFTTMIDTKKPTVDTLSVTPKVSQSFTIDPLPFTIEGFVRGDVSLSATVTDGYPQTGAFAALYYNDPFVMAGPPDGFEYLPIENFQDASTGTFGDMWSTWAYPDGIYVLGAGVMDQAGNSSDSSPVEILYLDNNQPWINNIWINSVASTLEPISGLWVPLVSGRTNVQMEANDWSGFLKEIEHRYVQAGMDPGPAGTPSIFTEYRMTVSFPLGDKQRSYRKPYTLDTCALSPGAYDAHAYATDWAGNISPIMGTYTFVVDNFTYIVPPSAAEPVVYFQENPPLSGNYNLWSEGRMENCNGPVNGLDVAVNHYHWFYNNPGLSYLQDYTYNTVATTVAGDLPAISAPAGSISFKSTDLGAVEYMDPLTWDIYGVFYPLFLGNPQSHLGTTFPPWHREFEPFNQKRILTNLSYDLTPTGPLTSSLSVTGNVIFQSGHPAVDERLYIDMGWTEPGPSWMWTTFSVVTGSSGEFTFAPPANILNTDPFNMQFYRNSPQWGWHNYGDLNWDPWNGWMEMLWW